MPEDDKGLPTEDIPGDTKPDTEGAATTPDLSGDKPGDEAKPEPTDTGSPYGDLETVNKRYAGAQRKITEQSETLKAERARREQLEAALSQFVQGKPGDKPAPDEIEARAKELVEKHGVDANSVGLIADLLRSAKPTKDPEEAVRIASATHRQVCWNQFEGKHGSEEFEPDYQKKLDGFLNQNPHLMRDANGNLVSNPYDAAHDYLKWQTERAEKVRIAQEKQAELEAQRKKEEAQKQTIANQGQSGGQQKLTPEEIERKKVFGLYPGYESTKSFYRE
jgi:hypothetical protein